MISGINSGKIQDLDIWKEYGLKVMTTSEKAEKDDADLSYAVRARIENEKLWNKDSVWGQNSYYYEMRFEEQKQDPEPDCVIVTDDTCDPYGGGVIKPANMSEEKWYEISRKLQEEMQPEREKIMNEYTQRKDPEWEKYVGGFDIGSRRATDKDADTGIFEDFLCDQVVRHNYTLTPEERSVFDWAASDEWRRNQGKFDVETKPTANAVNENLQKSDTKIPEDTAYKISFDKDLNFSVTGPDGKTAKIISDAINNNVQYRFKLAQSVYLHTTPDGKSMYEACKNPTNAFEYDAGILKNYFDYKMFDNHLRTTAGVSLSNITYGNDPAHPFLGKDEFTQKALDSSPNLVNSICTFCQTNSLKKPLFPSFSSSPIRFKNGEFSLNYAQSYESAVNFRC